MLSCDQEQEEENVGEEAEALVVHESAAFRFEKE